MAVPDCQAETESFLRGLTAGAPVETHISAVFVGADDVYKLKKAVRLPFLDFSSLAARGAMARRELALNCVAAPGIYKDVQAVVRGPDGALHLAADDAPNALDYVVRMARVPDADFFAAIAQRGALTPALLDALGDSVAALHGAMPEVAGWNSVEGMRGIILGNAVAARAAGLAEDAVAKWQQSVLAVLEEIAPTLAARALAGHVRRAHGDLHLGNLCLWHGVPTAFDMLEFDEALATIDAGYDLAFLLMDLHIQAGRDAANRVMNRYIARTGDTGLLACLPCFLSVRAMIRAHVLASGGDAEDAARYLRLSMDILQPAPAILLAIGGLPGTGKTTLARGVAPALGRAPGAFLLRSDELRKRLFGRAPEERLPASAYNAGANARINTALLAEAEAGLRSGQAVIIDSTFLNEGLRHGAEDAARVAGVPFFAVWLEADTETLVRRVAARTHDASDAGPDIVRQAAARDPGRISWLKLQAGDGAAVLASLRRMLGELPVDARSAAPGRVAHIRATDRRPGDGHDDGG